MTAHTPAVLQLVLALVFLRSSFAKMRHPRMFLRGVQDYDVLPHRLSSVFGIIVIVSETALAVSHLTGLYLHVVAPLGIALLVSFLLAVGINLRRGHAVPCYCLDQASDEAISARSVLKLVALIAAEVILVRSLYASTSSPHIFGTAHSIRKDVIAVVWVAIVFQYSSWFVRLPDLWTLGSRLFASSARISTPRPSAEERT